MAKGVELDELHVEVSPEIAARYREAKARLTTLAGKRMRRYYADPVAFAADCIVWPEGQSLTGYQEEVLSELPVRKRVAQRGPHGLGKSTSHAIAILWFALTRDATGVDWKIPTTAGGWHQLEQFLWPEVHKWAGRLDWERLGRDGFRRGQLLQLGLKLDHGTAFAVASSDPARIEGAHADALMFIYDEAKIISTETFNASEGAFSGATEGREALAFASSTPGEPAGRFYDIHTKRKGLEAWWTKHVTLDEALDAGRIAPGWVGEMKDLWGEGSALFNNRVLGEFHADDETSVIPLGWIEAAVLRWQESQLDLAKKYRGGHDGHVEMNGRFDRAGIDVAEAGGDKTVMSLWVGDRLHEFRVTVGEDTVQTASRAEGILMSNPGMVGVVDADGLGVGVYNDLKHAGCTVEAFHASARTDKKDEAGELGFINVRAAAWWNLREELDPRHGSTIELPDDAMLIGDLSAPKWEPVGRSQLKVESKKEIRSRLGRSTDHGDSAVMARWKDAVKKKRRMVFAGRAREEVPDVRPEA